MVEATAPDAPTVLANIVPFLRQLKVSGEPPCAVAVRVNEVTRQEDSARLSRKAAADRRFGSDRVIMDHHIVDQADEWAFDPHLIRQGVCPDGEDRVNRQSRPRGDLHPDIHAVDEQAAAHSGAKLPPLQFKVRPLVQGHRDADRTLDHRLVEQVPGAADFHDRETAATLPPMLIGKLNPRLPTQ